MPFFRMCSAGTWVCCVHIHWKAGLQFCMVAYLSTFSVPAVRIISWRVEHVSYYPGEVWSSFGVAMCSVGWVAD